MNSTDLFNSKVVCPACKIEFEVTRVKKSSLRLLKRDEDFCVYYKGHNPILYDAWVCEYCGYSSLSSKFKQISDKDVIKIRTVVTSKWSSRKFIGERDNKKALEAFKLVLFNDQILNSKKSEIAKVCMRIAWIYRYMNDKKEFEFLKYAFNAYKEAYEYERFPIDKLDEFTCMFILGELALRINLYEESIRWFRMLLSYTDAKDKGNIVRVGQDRFLIAKEKLKEKNLI